MNIRETAKNLIKAGYNIAVGFDRPNKFCSKDWCLYDYRSVGNDRPPGLIAFGRENVETILARMAQSANIQLG